MDRNEKARNLRQQEPGRGLRHATAATTPNLANFTLRRQTAHLCRAFGLTLAQAIEVAPLAFGGRGDD